MKKKIMVVDDEEDIIELLEMILESEGYDIIKAYSGTECLEKLKIIKPDLILLDIMMEPIDGWETLKEIKEDENLKDIPVSMLTLVNLNKEILNKEEIENINNYILKPFTVEDVKKKVKELLDTKDKMSDILFQIEKKLGSEIANEYEILFNKINRHKSLIETMKNSASPIDNELGEMETIVNEEEGLISNLTLKLIDIEKELERNNEIQVNNDVF